MKRKVFTLLLLSSITLCLCACGSSTSSANEAKVAEATPSQETSGDTKEHTTQEAVPEEAPTDDGIIDFSTDEFNAKYVKHEVSTDYEDKPALIIYYEYTNLGDDTSNFMFNVSEKLFQNGIQLETAILMDSPDEYCNSMLDIQKGATIAVASAYSLRDNDNPVTLEISELISFSDEKDTQEISIK